MYKHAHDYWLQHPFRRDPTAHATRDLPHSPAADRNAEPIIGVLRTVLPSSGVVLGIASGTGRHAVQFARAFRR